MSRIPAALLLLACLATPAAADRQEVARQSAVVIVLCEDGGRTPAGRAMEDFGRIALAPFVQQAYARRYWLVGARATPQALLETLRLAARQNRAVDLVLFAHGSPGKTHLAGGHLTPRQLVDGLKHRGGKKLRMVYTTTCYSDTMLAAWTEAGAWAVRGMKGVNRPLDFPRFFLGWLGGESYEEANQAGFETNQELHRIYNRYSPQLKARLLEMRRQLRGYQPLTEPGKQAREALLDALRLALRWFGQTRWDIEESRPKIRGPRARIDRLPEQRAARKAESAYH